MAFGYEFDITLDAGQLDLVTPMVFPSPLPGQDGNGVTNIALGNGVNVGTINPIGGSPFNDPVDWWIPYLTVFADQTLAIDRIIVAVVTPGALNSTVFQFATAAADEIGRLGGFVLPKGGSIGIQADDGGVVEAGDHRILFGAVPLLDGQQCCPLQRGINTMTPLSTVVV